MMRSLSPSGREFHRLAVSHLREGLPLSSGLFFFFYFYFIFGLLLVWTEVTFPSWSLWSLLAFFGDLPLPPCMDDSLARRTFFVI